MIGAVGCGAFQEVEPHIGGRARAHHRGVPVRMEVRDRRLEIVDDVGHVVQPRLVRAEPFPHRARGAAVILHQFDHHRSPLAVCRTVVEHRRLTAIPDLVKFDMAPHDERSGTDPGGPVRHGPINIGHCIGNLCRSSKPCRHNHVRSVEPSTRSAQMGNMIICGRS